MKNEEKNKIKSAKTEGVKIEAAKSGEDKAKKNKKREEKAKWVKFIDQNIDIMIVSVLKTCSDKNNPRTIDFIRGELKKRFYKDSIDNYFGSNIQKEEYMNKRIRIKLSELCDLGKVYVGEEIDSITWPEGVPTGLALDVYRILGGRVVLAREEDMKGKKEK